MLGVERVFSSAVPTGLGMARSEHGAMPIPSATVVELLRGAPVFSRGVSAELTTATGAAILAATVEGYGEIPALRVEEAGYGAGVGRLDFPNVTRVLIGIEEPATSLPSVPGTPSSVSSPSRPNRRTRAKPAELLAALVGGRSVLHRRDGVRRRRR